MLLRLSKRIKFAFVRPPESPRVAISVLAKGHSNLSGYTNLVLRNASVHRALAAQQPDLSIKLATKYLIFHEGNVTILQRVAISICSLPSRISFVNIGTYFDSVKLSSLKHSPYCHETALSRLFSDGYRCMCSFWFDGFLSFHTGYDYVVRIDDDCLVASLPLISIINDFRDSGCRYVTGMRSPPDDPEVTNGLSDLSASFYAENPGLEPPVHDRDPYTNLFVIDPLFFRSDPLFLRFANAVHRSGCIWINRWGDMPLWGAFLSMSISASPLKVRHDICYVHGSHSQTVNLSNIDSVASLSTVPRRWTILLFIDHGLQRLRQSRLFTSLQSAVSVLR
jgi:hypothetical protein